MENVRRWLFIVPGFVIVTAFQNCSVYQTSGRKFVEDGTAKQVKDNPPAAKVSEGAAKTSTCEPYLTPLAASEAMGVESTTKLVFDESTNTVSCVVSAADSSSDSAVDVAVCSISQNNLQLLSEAPDQTMVLDPYGPLSGGSLGFSRQLASGATQFIFVGSSNSALEAAACQFTFSSQKEFQSLSETAIDRSARLVHQIAPSLR